MYREKMRDLIKLGVLGFAVGFCLFLFLNLADGDGFHPIWSAQFGLFACGFPYGWRVTTPPMRGPEDRFAVWSLFFVVMAFGIHLIAAYFVGLIGYPIALVRCYFKMRKEA